ncbi:MAG: YIP1 family protein [Myxococcota bacterium]|nr:YIP1 family protein [Myxococcota bacterium]
MRARCPHCTTVFTTDRGGIQFCPSCGKQINVPAPAATPPGDQPPAAGAQPGGGDAWGAGLPPPPSGSASEAGFSGGIPPRPGGGYGGGAFPPDEPLDQPTPWEDRRRLGLLKAYGLTVKEVMLAPDKFWSQLSPTRKWVDALLFAWLALGIGSLLSLPLTLLQMGLQRDSAGLEAMPEEVRAVFEAFTQPASIVGWTLGSLLLYPLLFVIGAGIFHLLCLLFGAGKNGFGATARAVGYSTAPLLLAGVPCLNVVAFLYFYVLLVWGTSRVQRTDWWRPLAALLLPLVVLCCCGGVLAVVAAGAGMNAAR